MFAKISFRPGSTGRRARLLALICALALGAAACQGVPSNSSDPTPTATRTPTAQTDFTSLDEPTATRTPDSTEIAGSGGGEAEDSDDVCSLISQDEAEEVLGQAVVSITPGVDEDSLSGQPLNFCTWMGSGRAVVLSVVDTGSLEQVGETLNQELENMQDEDDPSDVMQWPGLGDLAYWATNSRSASFTVQTGTVVFSLAVGGNLGDPGAFQEALERLAATVVGRFQ